MSTQNPTLAFLAELLTVGVGIITAIATGGVSADAEIVNEIGQIAIAAIPVFQAPSISGIAAILGQASALLAKVNQPGAAADVKLADAVLKIVQAATAAISAQAGQPINPGLLTPETPIS